MFLTISRTGNTRILEEEDNKVGAAVFFFYQQFQFKL
jgi:hypothetical protein